jgi:hypothetical protein
MNTKKGVFMQEKDIKYLVKKQLKKEFPHWSRLSKHEKKKLANQVLEEVTSNYAFDEEITAPINELTGTPSLPNGIISVTEMEDFIRDSKGPLLNLTRSRYRKPLRDLELKAIDELLDNAVVNRILSMESYTPSMRKLFPCHLFRAELLKSLKYAEFSYRKYCKDVLNKLESKTERIFVHLPLHKKLKIDHSQLSQFRSGLSIKHMVNLLSYIVYVLIHSGKIGGFVSICGVDSSELPACCSPVPLATVNIGNKKVRIYSDLDADCGKRRKKRDKSDYFVGYRLHTLVAINPDTGENYPLVSLVAPGNHHDKLFLPQLLSFATAIGLDIKLITADEAYADAEQNEAAQKDFGVSVITPPDKKVKLPENVDPKTHAVYMHNMCEIPMEYMGRTDKGHEFKCGDDSKACHYVDVCPKYREIPVDAGLFGQIPEQAEGIEEVRAIRKHMERLYNLLKHREGLEPLRVRSQHGVMAVATFANISTLLLEIVETRKSKEKRQQRLDLAT